MSRDDKVICETPTPGKKPTRIDRWKYDAIRAAILKVLAATDDGVAFKHLPHLVGDVIEPSAREKIGSMSWYTTTVKLDLEAKGEIHRVEGARPQRLVKARG
jgi:hypothetical protein